jgi:transcriptional regulator with XRE-family HTH domain
MFDPEDSGRLAVDIGRRLRLTRQAMGIENQVDFGREAGLSQPHYNLFETGSRPLTLQAALKLCDRYNLTLDWLYRGDPSGLPYKLAKEINNVRKSTQ